MAGDRLDFNVIVAYLTHLSALSEQHRVWYLMTDLFLCDLLEFDAPTIPTYRFLHQVPLTTDRTGEFSRQIECQLGLASVFPRAGLVTFSLSRSRATVGAFRSELGLR